MKKEMKDKQDKVLIHRYVDGELSNDEAKIADALIKKSPEAKREYDEIRAVGNALRTAVHDETEHVDFRGLWANVNEGIEQGGRNGFAGMLDYFFRFITPRRAVAAFAGMLAIVAGAIIVWELSLAPAPVQAAPTTVESIQYGSNADIVVAVDTLNDPATTVVWIEGIDINKENDPPDEM